MLNGKRNKGKKRLVFLFAALAGVLFFLPPKSASASANSAPAYWRGADGMGVVATDGNCPIEVTREELTFDISTLPETNYETAEQFAGYRASVTAEYTFHNPTQEALSVGLAFPFGAIPEYLMAYDGETGETAALDDSDRYFVTVDGAAAETQLRYTYYRENYGGESALFLPADGKAESGLFRENADCFVFSYMADTQGAAEDLVLEVRLAYNPARTRILREYYRDYEVEDGDLLLFLNLGTNDPVRFFAVGEKPRVKHAKVVKGGTIYGDRVYPEGFSVVSGEGTAKFGAWVEESRPKRVGEIDWFNAVLAYLAEGENSAYGLVHRVPAFLAENELMRWFTYSLTVPQGGSVVNRVTAPLYPGIGSGSYDYSYLLSPAQGWAKFGTFSLRIKTDLPIYHCSLDLKQGEGEYTYEREGLPIGELTFEINPSGAPYGGGSGLNWISLPLILLGVHLGLGLIAGIVILIVYFVKIKRARARKGENPRPPGG